MIEIIFVFNSQVPAAVSKKCCAFFCPGIDASAGPLSMGVQGLRGPRSGLLACQQIPRYTLEQNRKRTSQCPSAGQWKLCALDQIFITESAKIDRKPNEPRRDVRVEMCRVPNMYQSDILYELWRRGIKSVVQDLGIYL